MSIELNEGLGLKVIQNAILCYPDPVVWDFCFRNWATTVLTYNVAVIGHLFLFLLGLCLAKAAMERILFSAFFFFFFGLFLSVVLISILFNNKIYIYIYIYISRSQKHPLKKRENPRRKYIYRYFFIYNINTR